MKQKKNKGALHLSTSVEYEEIFKMKIMENYLQSKPVSLEVWKDLLLQGNRHCQKEIELAYANVKRELLGQQEEQ